MTSAAWTLVWLRNGGDYYAGEQAGIYRDGALVWSGYSYDAAEDIVQAVVGGDAVTVREWRPADRHTLDFPARLTQLEHELQPER